MAKRRARLEHLPSTTATTPFLPPCGYVQLESREDGGREECKVVTGIPIARSMVVPFFFSQLKYNDSWAGQVMDVLVFRPCSVQYFESCHEALTRCSLD